MDLSQFEAVFHSAMNDMPVWVHKALDNLDVLIVDEPSADLYPCEDGLLGLHVGLPLPEHLLNFSPLPHGHGSFLPTFVAGRTKVPALASTGVHLSSQWA